MLAALESFKTSISLSQYIEGAAMNSTICNAQNECRYTGLERMHAYRVIKPGLVARLYKDNFGQFRIVLFQAGQGVSAVLVGPDMSIRYKHTMVAHRGHNYTRQLQALLWQFGIKWRASDWQTKAGQACYGQK
jgi:hypothetical protein